MLYPPELQAPITVKSLGHSAWEMYRKARTAGKNGWCAWQDLNLRHLAPEASALSRLSYTRGSRHNITRRRGADRRSMIGVQKEGHACDSIASPFSRSPWPSPCVSIAPARADESANNIFRLGAGWMDPDGETTTGGVELDVDATTSYFVSYERRLIPWLGLDFQVSLCGSRRPCDAHRRRSDDNHESEATWNGSAGVNFHLFARSRFDFYLGAYYSYTEFDTAFDNASGYGGVVGFDIGITKSGLAITTAVRYTVMEVDVMGAPGGHGGLQPPDVPSRTWLEVLARLQP